MLRARRTDSHMPSVAHRRKLFSLPPPPAAVVVVGGDGGVGYTRLLLDCLYVCIDDDGGPARSSSIRTRAIVAEVTGWHFTFPSWDLPIVLIHWETHRKRITAVSLTS